MSKHIPVLAPIAEKAAWSFVQGFLVFFLGAGALDWSNTQAGVAAGVAAVVSFLLATVTATAIPNNLTFYQDLGLRVLRTGGAAFLAALVVDPSLVLAGETWKSAAAAGATAALAIVKGAAAHFVGNPKSASTLPTGSDPTSPLFASGDLGEDDDELNEPGELPDWALNPDPSTR